MRWLELKIPPPVVAGITGLGMWLSRKYAPSLGVDFQWHREVGLSLVIAGVFLDLTGFIEFRKARTTINPLRPGNTSAMVVSGIYRHTRNPMYLGLLLSLTGWATYLSHPLALLGLSVFVAYLTRFQIIPEERLLAFKFGADYAAYKATVRRWI